ncbi:MAG: family 10 glycosylhydrolase, partial [Victivallaceae bacterium]
MLKKALRILGIVFLVLYAWTMAEAKEQSRIGVIGRTGWLDLGKEYGYEINIVDGKVFDDLQEAQKYRMIIIGDKGSMFSEKQYKNIEKYVEDGGILAILYYYACRYVDINGNGKYDSGKDRRNRNNWIMPKVSGVKNNGIYFLGEIQFQNESFLARGFSKDKRYKLDQSLKAFTKFTAKLEPLKGTEVIASAKLFKCIKKGGKHYTYQGDEVGEGAIFTANKYGKGLCVQSGVYLAYGALNRKCPVCLQLIKNIFSLAGPAGKRETGARELHKEPELEGRGFWLAPFKYFNMKDEAEGRKQIKELMKTAAGNNFNFVNVRAHRGPLALYNSKVLPLKYSNWDVLGAVIEEAHNYGIEVFPVIISDFRHSLRKNGVGPIMESHPGWLTMEREEDCKSFAQYMKDIVMELADNYDIDGICYDDEDGVRNGKNGWRKY